MTDDTEDKGKPIPPKTDTPIQDINNDCGNPDCGTSVKVKAEITRAVRIGIEEALETPPELVEGTYNGFEKCYNDCTYCGGWYDVGNGPYQFEHNTAIMIQNPQLGVRKVCSKCLITLFDGIMVRGLGKPGVNNNENPQYR